MAESILPFPVDQVATEAANSDGGLSADLGNVYRGKDGNLYRLVQAASDIASAAKKTLVTATSGSNPASPTWKVDTTTTANDAHVVGVVPSDITAETTTSGTIDQNEYFFVQVSGPTTTISAAAIADNAEVGTSTTAGKVDDATIDGAGSIGTAMESASGADEDIGVYLKGLV